MYMLKLLFQKLWIDKALPGSWENSWPPGALLKITTWGQLEASRPLCSRERQTTVPWEQLTAQDRNVAASFTQSSLNLKALTAPCLFPVMKSLAWKEKGRWCVREWIHHLLGSLAIWIKRPQRFDLIHCWLCLAVTSSLDTGVFSGFTIVFMYIHLQRCRCARFCLLSLDLVYSFRFLIWVQK